MLQSPFRKQSRIGKNALVCISLYQSHSSWAGLSPGGAPTKLCRGGTFACGEASPNK